MGNVINLAEPVAGFLLAIRGSVEASIWFETHAGADAGEAR